VVGALAPHAPEIRLAALDRSQRAPTTIVEDVDDMAALFASHDLAVAAAGTSALELACAGIPAALVAVADNQRPVLSAAARLGCAAALGWHGDVDEARIADCLSALAKDLPLRTTMAARGRELVDGAGAERVANKIIHLARIRAAS
jgi:spore coat polysaccharide biosynthesis predicted glycosyltransferase SpsG